MAPSRFSISGQSAGKPCITAVFGKKKVTMTLYENHRHYLGLGVVFHTNDPLWKFCYQRGNSVTGGELLLPPLKAPKSSCFLSLVVTFAVNATI